MKKQIIRLGLERVHRALALLGHPEDSFASVLIAGTNGKGSVAAMTESVLRAAGYRTGLFTSPHLVEARERVRLGGVPISAAAWRRHARKISALRERHRLGLTEFEEQALLSFLCFAEGGVQIAVVEVGLGGRLDAANALPAPEVCAMTSVGHDHLNWLGPTLKHVFLEKAGVARPGTPLVCALPPTLNHFADNYFRGRCVPAWRLGREIRAVPGATRRAAREQRFNVALPRARYAGLRIGLLGPHQVQNAALSAAICRVLMRRGWNLHDGDIRRGLSRARWPGRFQTLRAGGQWFVLDGAHNREAAAALGKAFRAWSGRKKKAALVFGCLKDKDARAMARRLAPLAARVYTVNLPTERSRTAGELSKLFGGKARACRDFGEALGLVKKEKGAPVLITGSLYLVGEALKTLKGGVVE